MVFPIRPELPEEKQPTFLLHVFLQSCLLYMHIISLKERISKFMIEE